MGQRCGSWTKYESEISINRDYILEKISWYNVAGSRDKKNQEQNVGYEYYCGYGKQLKWYGHLRPMNDERIPMKVLNGTLAQDN